MVRLLVEKTYGQVQFRLAPVMGRAAMKATTVLPPLAPESNPTAANLLGKFLGFRVQPDIPVKSAVRKLIPEEAIRLSEVPGAHEEMRRLPPTIRESLYGMSRLVADVRGIDPVTGMRVSTAVSLELQEEILAATEAMHEEIIASPQGLQLEMA
jgi:hypothetical protein